MARMRCPVFLDGTDAAEAVVTEADGFSVTFSARKTANGVEVSTGRPSVHRTSGIREVVAASEAGDAVGTARFGTVVSEPDGGMVIETPLGCAQWRLC